MLANSIHRCQAALSGLTLVVVVLQSVILKPSHPISSGSLDDRFDDRICNGCRVD